MSPVKGEAPSATPGLPLHAFPDWGKPVCPGDNAWTTEFPPLPPAPEQQDAIENPQQGSLSPTQCDVEEDGMEPEAKRANVFQDTLDIQKYDDAFSIEEHNTFVELLKGFWFALQSNLPDLFQWLITKQDFTQMNSLTEHIKALRNSPRIASP